MRTPQVHVKVEKYTIKHFNAQFPDDTACLTDIFNNRYPNGLACEKCGRQNSFTRITNRRAYACHCGFQVYPTAGTIFHKSSTALKTWYLAIFYMSASKNGVAALELQRHIGVTYKCAWRMMHQIRKLMGENPPPFRGTVELDETYVGGVRPGKRGRGAAGKTPVVGILERQGNVMASVVENTKAITVLPIVVKSVAAGATIMTDDYPVYNKLSHGDRYSHHVIEHGRKEYVRGEVHTNGIEGFWSQMKRSIDGTHHHVSGKHLQKYADEYSFRYNRRKSETPMFQHITSRLISRRAA